MVRAYLDAGSASMLLQLVLGGFAAVAVGAKLYWGRLMRLLRIRKPEAEPTETEPSVERAGTEPSKAEPVALSGAPTAERTVVESRGR